LPRRRDPCARMDSDVTSAFLVDDDLFSLLAHDAAL
jgi:hypothetical protein